jgi:hypothetical protein
MPNRNYEQGARFEREVIARYKADGAACIRASGSHGLFDVVAIYPGNLSVFTQCKVTKSESHAESLLKKFQENPPLPAGFYIQVLEVKIPRKGTRSVIIPAKTPTAPVDLCANDCLCDLCRAARAVIESAAKDLRKHGPIR